ncbi:MAG: energy transducer TonB, partial [Longimicrobiales bacterium]
MADLTDNGRELPPELARLDRELSSITIEERPSFGPELEAELEREWASPARRRPVLRMKHAVAAAIGALMLAAVAAPQARASIARLLSLGFGQKADTEIPVPERPGPLPSVELVGGEAPVTDLGATMEERQPLIPGLSDYSRVPMDVTFPDLLNRAEHERLIAEEYPLELSQAGIGGTVRVRLWVDVNGSVDYAQFVESSGVEALDRFALDVAADLRFAPARRAGMTVGAWVELPLVFEADEDV